jgi:cytochrome c
LSLIKAISIYVVISAVASLALACIHPFGDAGLYAAKAAQTPLLSSSQVPAPVRAILVEKCADCHSNQTRAPFYGRFAPSSWLMEHDIVEARKAMNLSLWNAYSSEQQQKLAAKIAHEANSHRMPPVQYRLIHWNARVSDPENQILAQWARASAGLESDAEGPAGEGDPQRGKALFEKRCTGCHSLTKNSRGPRLQGVYGRAAGTATGYAYSAALKNARLVWDGKSLDRWLNDSDAFLPGNEMDFQVAKAQDRRDLIRYLELDAGR